MTEHLMPTSVDPGKEPFMSGSNCLGIHNADSSTESQIKGDLE